MKMSTTLPYLSKYGNRSSAVVPKIHTQTRSYTKPFNFIPTKILERERERGAYGRWCWERGESRCRWCPEGLFFRSATLLQGESDEWGVDWIRLGLGFVCCGEIGDRTELSWRILSLVVFLFGVGGFGSKFIYRHWGYVWLTSKVSFCLFF